MRCHCAGSGRGAICSTPCRREGAAKIGRVVRSACPRIAWRSWREAADARVELTASRRSARRAGQRKRIGRKYARQMRPRDGGSCAPGQGARCDLGRWPFRLLISLCTALGLRWASVGRPIQGGRLFARAVCARRQRAAGLIRFRVVECMPSREEGFQPFQSWIAGKCMQSRECMLSVPHTPDLWLQWHVQMCAASVPWRGGVSSCILYTLYTV